MFTEEQSPEKVAGLLWPESLDIRVRDNIPKDGALVPEETVMTTGKAVFKLLFAFCLCWLICLAVVDRPTWVCGGTAC